MARRRGKKKVSHREKGVEPAPVAVTTPNRASPPRKTTLLAAAGIVLLLGIAALFRFGLSPEIERRPLNVILVTADTLRADKLGAYGNENLATPNLDRLAESGVLFENASTVAPITLPAHASIFTGSYPIHHGVRDNGAQSLASERTTLAEVLKANGYDTGAFVGAFVLDSRFGLDQGFDLYDDEIEGAPDVSERRGDEVLERALTWIDSVRDRRFFSWIHLFDPHVPYDPPPPFRRSEDSQALYDGEVAYVDSLVGGLIEFLEEKELEDDTLVVFVADHGESLGEHGELTHGFFVYDATMRVPLIVRSPHSSLAGRLVAAQVRTVDLVPTILDLLGFEPPPEVQGQSLVPLATGSTDSLDLAAYGESIFPSHYGWSPLESLRTEKQLFVAAPRPEIYDLVRDPRSLTNLAPERAATVRDLEKRIEEIRSRSRAPAGASAEPAPLDEETRSRLSALGYASGAPARPSGDASGSLADPKDKIEIFTRIREAAADADAGRTDEAIAKMERVVSQDPEIVEAYNLLGRFYSTRGDLANAARAYESALARDPFHLPASLGLSRIHIDAGRFREALTVLQPIDGSRADAALHEIRAQAYAGTGDLEAAERNYEKLIELSPGSASAHFNLAKLLGQMGREEAMIAHLEKSIEVDPGFSVAHLYLANACLERGELERAVELANQGIALGPEPALAPFGHFILADAYDRLGLP
ncbi:MAG: sulfatase-like hydrolase/transferase, partial [Vicinamibacteria bacterium]